MLIIEDEFGVKHVVNDKYDNKEILVRRTQLPEWDELKPTDQLSRSGFNWNRTSTRINERRDATLITNGIPSYLGNGLKKGSRNARNW